MTYTDCPPKKCDEIVTYKLTNVYVIEFHAATENISRMNKKYNLYNLA